MKQLKALWLFWLLPLVAALFVTGLVWTPACMLLDVLSESYPDAVNVVLVLLFSLPVVLLIVFRRLAQRRWGKAFRDSMKQGE